MRARTVQLERLALHREDYAFVGQPRLLARLPLRCEADAVHHTLIDTLPTLPLFSYVREGPNGGSNLRFGRLRFMGTIAAIRALVLRGEGVAVLPRYLVAPDLKAGRLERVLPRLKAQADYFWLMFRSGDLNRPLYDEMAKVLRAAPLR
jgi:DNA-binding transcriptional LysR family regulator